MPLANNEDNDAAVSQEEQGANDESDIEAMMDNKYLKISRENMRNRKRKCNLTPKLHIGLITNN